MISPGQYITLDDYNRARICDSAAAPSAAPRLLKVGRGVDDVAVSPDGKHLVLRMNLDFAVYDLATGVVTTLHRPLRNEEVVYEDGPTVLSSSGKFLFSYWNSAKVFRTSPAPWSMNLPAP